jgi:hypothetical protein
MFNISPDTLHLEVKARQAALRACAEKETRLNIAKQANYQNFENKKNTSHWHWLSLKLIWLSAKLTQAR